MPAREPTYDQKPCAPGQHHLSRFRLVGQRKGPSQPRSSRASQSEAHGRSVGQAANLRLAATLCLRHGSSFAMALVTLVDASGNRRPGYFFGIRYYFVSAETHGCDAVSTECRHTASSDPKRHRLDGRHPASSNDLVKTCKPTGRLRGTVSGKRFDGAGATFSAARCCFGAHDSISEPLPRIRNRPIPELHRRSALGGFRRSPPGRAGCRRFGWKAVVPHAWARRLAVAGRCHGCRAPSPRRSDRVPGCRQHARRALVPPPE